MTPRKTARRTTPARKSPASKSAPARTRKAGTSSASGTSKAAPKKRPRKPAAPPQRRVVSPGLSADEFKGEIARRGWTMLQVAERWEMGRNWLYKLAANPQRGARWDDAVRGLPQVLQPADGTRA